jgi:hypothetical protein
MQNTITNTLEKGQSPAVTRQNHRYLATLAAFLLSSIAVPVTAQTAPTMKLAAESGFTIAPDVSASIVLKTLPDAVCDLHGEGIAGNAQTMKFYANGEGYLKIHARIKEEGQEARAQLDCTAKGSITRYPLHLLASDFPTSDMPTPRSTMPAPKGSVLQPALTEAEAQVLSDDELTSRGFPPRPDSPDAYATWLEVVTRPSIMVDPHLASRSDVVHHLVQAGVTHSSNWSGYVADASKNRTYSSVHGEWNVPDVLACENVSNTFSAFWIGLDGFGLSELNQEGTEQDCYYIGGSYYTNYYAWSELLPNQPTEQQITGFAPNPGDYMYATQWIGNKAGTRTNNGSGGYVWFYMNDMSQGVYAQFSTKLNGTYFDGKTVEWIMERPGLGGGSLAELSDYGSADMLNAQGFTTKGNWVNYSALGNLQRIWLYNDYVNGPDNNLLSSAADAGSSTISFQWHHWH